ncbi:MAG: phosphate/phosphite/phosphonate ABC transporter substrate-binding protein [Gammaproteobacteria bacterium]|nr:phosphate/phosphite/phosphonate ABC transporter substrate-binding protein [Gammaproteobacteria bacterium]
MRDQPDSTDMISRALNSYVLKICTAALMLTLVWSGTVVSSDATEQDETEYSYGVFPYLSEEKLKSVHDPIAADFKNSLGQTVRLETPATYQHFLDDMNRERFDIVFVQPFDYVWGHDNHNYIPLARREQQLETIFLTKAESDIQTISDLRGKVVAMLDSTAAVSQIGTRDLLQAGIIPGADVAVKFYRTHTACMESVSSGKADSCITERQPLKHFALEKSSDLRVFHQGKTIPHTLYAVHKRVPESDREKLKLSILSWSERPAGKNILEKNHQSKFVPARDDEYNIVRYFWLSQFVSVASTH